MNRLFDWIARSVARRPGRALVGLAIVTVGLAAGSGLLGEQADTSVFLPDDSDVAVATRVLAESFPDSAGLTNVTILHRGDVLTPGGLAHIDAVVAAAAGEPEVAARLALTNPVISISAIYKQALQTPDLSTASQTQIDGVTAALRADPELGPVLDGLVGEADGEDLAITSIRLRRLGDPDGLETAELRLADVVAGVEGPLDVRSLSSATINQESAESSSSSMGRLMVVALAVIVLLLFVFFRTASDVALSLAGLGITIVGTLGFQGIMGPDGFDLIGLPNTITTLVPIMLIGLVVDYSIQTVAHYRELRVEGKGVTEAARRGLRGVLLPLGLAAGTTVISFLTNVASPIPANKDFGIVAAFGVFFGLTVMLTLLPAARTLLDRRRQAKGPLGRPRPIADALPGTGPIVRRVGVFVARKPMVVLAVTAVVTVVLGAATFNISTEFDTNDFLPSGGETLTDIAALEEALGGQTEAVTVLIEAELTDDRTLRNLVEVSRAFEDDLSRPTGATGTITSSLGTLFLDWVDDSGEPGDNYDPELLEMAQDVDQGLTLDPVGLQALFDRLQANDPVGFAQVAANDPNGTDAMLVQFNALTGDQDRTRQMVADIEGLWFGDRDQITVTSGDIVGVAVTDSMTESQTSSIAITIVAALIVLTLFFWATEFKPMLAMIAVFPIVLVLLWVLGTMTLLGIPYNVVTALITALSIGIGVDYTIHVIHRFTEELAHRGSVEEATTTTLSTTGSALVGSALTTALGFGVLLFSPLIPFRQFGLVTGITILYALLVAVVVVPPLLVVWAAYHEWRRTAFAAPTRETQVEQPRTKLDNAKALYLEGIRDGNVREAVETYTGDRYTQHSTGVRDGVEGFVEFFEAFIRRNPVRDIEIVRGLEDGRYLFVHAHQSLNDGEAQWVTMDFFDTDDDGKIVEHWDVIAPYSESTPSGHTSVDGPTEVTDLELTEDNKALVRRMIEDVLIPGGEPANVGRYISSEQYIQHNKDVPDGLESFRRLATAEDRSLVYDEIVLLVGQGNFVATLCRARWKDEPYAQADLFRIEDGLIVEHWDAAEPIGPSEEWVNSGKF